MRKLSIFIALVAFAAVAMLLVGQGSTPTQAGGDPVISLDAVDTACSGAHEDKCTLNATDSFQVSIDITNDQGISNGFADWDATVTFGSNLTNDSTKDISSDVCVGTSSVDGTSSPISIDCTGVTAKAHTGSELAVLNFTCNNAGSAKINVSVNIDQDGNGSNDFTNLSDSIEINCGQSARISLDDSKIGGVEKPVFVGDKMTVSVKIDELKLVNADGDAKAGGYNGWQARVNFDATKLELQSVSFPGDLVPLQNPPLVGDVTNTILVGVAIGTGQNESVVDDNVAELTFLVLTAETIDGDTDVTLSTSEADTHLVPEKGGQLDGSNGLTFGDTTFEQDTFAAQFSLSVKDGDCKPVSPAVPNTCRLLNGGSVTISVNLDRVQVNYNTVRARIQYDSDGALINDEFLNVSNVTFGSPTCAPTTGTIISDNNKIIRVSCDQVPASSTAKGNVFDIELTCKNQNPNDKDSETVILQSAGNQTTVLIGATAQPALLGKSVTVVCVGDGSDGDGDGCTVAQEAGLSPALDPNAYDFPNADRANGLEDISAGDVVAYVQDFATDNLLSVAGAPGTDLDDIIHAGKYFGQSCAGSPTPSAGPKV